MIQGRMWSGDLSLCSSITSSRVVPNMEGLNGASCEGMGREGMRREGQGREGVRRGGDEDEEGRG